MARHINKKFPDTRLDWGIFIIAILIFMVLLFVLFNILFKNPVF
jgi:hypothetical protein